MQTVIEDPEGPAPKTLAAQTHLFTLRLPNDPGSLALAQGTVTAALGELGFAHADTRNLQLASAEACRNVLAHAYRPGEDRTYEVAGTIEFGKLKLRVRDTGLPFDPFHVAGQGLHRIEQLVHELRYVNLGRDGKAFDLLYTLPGGWEQHPHPLAAQPADDSPPPDAATLHVRLFEPADAGQVARCAYGVYGYSYFGEHLYIPERLIAMNQRGDLVSAVLADAAGRVFGHLALVFGPDRAIPEEGQAFILPTVRGGGWFKKLKAFLYDVAAQRGLPGVFSDGVTVHPFTQKANLSMGSRACGILLAFAPGNVEFKQISAGDPYRHSLVVFYKPLQEHPHGQGHVPAQHAAMIAAIYANLGIPFAPLPAVAPALAPATIMDAFSNPLRGISYLVVRTFGADFLDTLKHQLRQLCNHGIAVIQLDLPLTDPAAAHFSAGIEALGFFFCAVVPRYFGAGASLRYQYLNDVEINTDTIVLEGDFSKQLLAYILRHAPT